MDVRKIPAGKNIPEDIYAVIEIPQGSNVKYEVDKESGATFVDRFLYSDVLSSKLRLCSKHTC